MPIIMNMGIRTLRPQIPSGPEDRATGSQMTTALVPMFTQYRKETGRAAGTFPWWFT